MKSKGQFITDKIAQMTQVPDLFSLSGCPNYLEFKAKHIEKQKIWRWFIANTPYTKDDWNVSGIAINPANSRDSYQVRGYRKGDPDYENGSSSGNGTTVIRYHFKDENNERQCALDLIEALKEIDFLNEGYEIKQDSGLPTSLNNSIVLEAKTNSNQYAFTTGGLAVTLHNFIEKEGENPFANENRDANKTLQITVKDYNYEEKYTPNLETSKEEQIKEFEKFVATNTKITLTELTTNTEHEFKGTKIKENISNTTFFVDSNPSITAQNIQECLQHNNFINSNFYVDIPFYHAKNTFSNQINIVPRNNGNIQECDIFHSNSNCVESAGATRKTNNDMIFNGATEATIELDIYTDTDMHLVGSEFPENSLGKYMTTLKKTYHGQPLWFDLNALMANKNSYETNFINPRFTSWCPTGTLKDYRFVAKRFDGKNREPFYVSEPLYSINGYDRNLERKNIENYIYDPQKPLSEKIAYKVRPLTNQPELTHIENQHQYFNIILGSKEPTIKVNTISLIYKLYTQSKTLITDHKPNGEYELNSVPYSNLSILNTIKLDIDEAINIYKRQLRGNAQEVGYVTVKMRHTEAYGSSIEVAESETLEYRILPACLHTVNDFAFLNALGGWSSFNFGGERKTDFKASSTSIYKTQTPHFNISDNIETVYSQDIKEQFSAKTTPINSETVEWLKEMSASMAVFELKTKRYIIVDELNIKQNSKDDLFVVELKYRYSDSYNGKVK